MCWGDHHHVILTEDFTFIRFQICVWPWNGEKEDDGRTKATKTTRFHFGNDMFFGSPTSEINFDGVWDSDLKGQDQAIALRNAENG